VSALPQSPLARGYALFGLFVLMVAIALATEHQLFHSDAAGIVYLVVSTGTLLAGMGFLVRAAWVGPLQRRLLAVPGLMLGGLYLAVLVHGPG
jgi:Zn-dependent protease